MASADETERRLAARILLPGRAIVLHQQTLLLGLAMASGAAAALGAVGFREMLGLFQWIAFGTNVDSLIAFALDLPWWQRLAMPTLGGLIVGYFIHRFVPGGRPVAVTEVMEASAIRGAKMSLNQGLLGALANAAALGFGASSGREGPVVHFGATIGSRFARWFRRSREQSRTLLGCGIAAAVAASFNAPLAGVFFALEVVIGHYAVGAFAPIVLASLVATIISRQIYGDFPAFSIPSYSLSYFEFPAFAMLGVAAAVLAVSFVRLVPFVEKQIRRLPVPPWTRPAVGGLGVGIIAIAFPEVLGVGYGTTDDALQGELSLVLLLALLVVKTIATALTIGSGFGGGVFSPSLFLGAMLGGATGIIAGHAVPSFFQSTNITLFAGAGAYSLVGMGAVAGAILGAPISTILIIFELTGDYQLTMGVMLSTVVASVITTNWHGSSYFRDALARRGVDLSTRFEQDLLTAERVEHLMSKRYSAISLATSLVDLRLLLQTAPYNEVFVVTDDGRLFGSITLADLDEAAFDHALDGLVIAADVARRHPPMLEVGDNLRDAIALMETVQEEHVPVVDNRYSRRLVGFVHEKDVMLAYTKALVRLHKDEGAAF
jgi:chloride channel protein, CIC family